MSDLNNAVANETNAADDAALNAAATAQAPKVLTKDEKLAKIKGQIDKLTQRYDDVLNDRQPAPKAKKEVYIPSAGDVVIATVGRNTATSQASTEKGTVIAVKFPEVGEDGKAKGSTQVRVRIKEGQFEEQVVTLYPAQLVKFVDETTEAADAEGEEDDLNDGSDAIGSSDPQ